MKKELLLTTLMYFIVMGMILFTVYRFFIWRGSEEFSILILIFVLFLIFLGWWYLVSSLILTPDERMKETLEKIVDDIMHELNIPLSTIQANSSMLRKSLQKEEKLLKRVQRIEDASKRFERLYKELSYAIKKEMKEIIKERFELSAMIRERVVFFQEQERNPFHLTLKDSYIYADRIGFEQMLDNLVENAMKYSSKEKPITIILNKGILRIKDEGIGMETAELLQVLERYYQVDSKQRGHGIGLSLVKSYCDSEGIELKILSTKGIGTEVVLDLKAVMIS